MLPFTAPPAQSRRGLLCLGGGDGLRRIGAAGGQAQAEDQGQDQGKGSFHGSMSLSSENAIAPRWGAMKTMLRSMQMRQAVEEALGVEV